MKEVGVIGESSMHHKEPASVIYRFHHDALGPIGARAAVA